MATLAESRDQPCSGKYNDILDRTTGIFLAPLKTTGNPLTTVAWALLHGGMLKGTELVKNMHVVEARWRLYKTGVSLYVSKVGYEGAETFLANSPVELHDPFTGNPFLWDKEGGYIYFESPFAAGIRDKFHIRKEN